MTTRFSRRRSTLHPPKRMVRWTQVAFLAASTVLAACWLAPHLRAADEAPPWESLLQRETAAIRAARGWASNIQYHRDSGRVRFLRYSKPQVLDEHLQVLAVCDQLRYLAIVSPSITDAGLSHAAPLRHLESLMLADSGISDASMPWVGSQQRLTKLFLDRTAVTDTGIQSLRGLSQLEELTLAGTHVTGEGLAALAELPSLKVLALSKLSKPSKPANRFSKSPTRTPARGDEGDAVDAGLLAVLGDPAGWPSLESLSLDGIQVMGPIKSRDSKRYGLAGLAHRSKLTRLSLVGARLDVTALEQLAELTQLKQLNLSQAEAPPDAVEALRAALPDTQIHFGAPSSLWQRWRQTGQVATARPDESPPQQSRPPLPPLERLTGAPAGSALARPDFQRHVLPLLGRLGCNGRTCHGSFQGRGGFRLSMFGYDFSADRDAIAGGESPRVDRDHPIDSLLLYKPTHGDEHGGGQRLDEGSWQYELLLRWIQNGAVGAAQPRQLAQLEVSPAEMVFAEPGEQVQLRCIAVWADGRREDVTRFTRFQSNDPAVATVTPEGELTVVGAGETHIISMYDNGVAATQILLPRVGRADSGPSEPTGRQPADRGIAPSPARTIDRMVQSKLDKLGIEPSGACDDAAFLRRVSLDIAGTLPTPGDVRRFVADESADKRERIIDQLLASPAHTTWFAMWLSDLTGSNAQYLGTTDMNQPAAQQWNAWLRRRVEQNAGWDEIAAGILLATSRQPGESYEQYAARQSAYLRRHDPDDFSAADQPMHYYWFRSNNQQPADRALAFGYIFLGIRLQCAQCHKHPFDRWSQEDFEQFSNFFRRIKIGAAPDAVEPQRLLKSKLGVPQRLNTAALRRQMYLRVSAEGLPIPWNEVWVESPNEAAAKPQHQARVLGGVTIDLRKVRDPREPLVAWLLSPENPYFARAMVNRVWRRYLGVGIVEPVDDLNRANPPSNAELMDYLAEQFIASGYDLRWLQRTICNTAAYQRRWEPTESNRKDERNFARATLRRLPAEVTIDAILQATATDSRNGAWSRDMAQRKIGQHPKSIQARGIDYSLLIFGKPLRTTNCDCQRQDQPTLLQSLYVRNDAELLGMLERPDGWLQQLSKSWQMPLSAETTTQTSVETSSRGSVAEQTLTDAIEQAYLRTLSREPTTAEKQIGLQHVQSLDNPLEGLRDLLWSLVNTQEFLLNH